MGKDSSGFAALPAGRGPDGALVVNSFEATMNEALHDRRTAGALEANRMWEVSPDLLAITDAGGIYLDVNPAWTAILQWSGPELVGQDATWLIHPEDREKSQINWQTVGATPLLFESRIRHKNGTYSPFSWIAVRAGHNIYAAARDISALRRAQDNLRVSLNAIGEADRHRTMLEMTAWIAHELNQPLASIIINGQAGLRWMSRPEPDLGEVRRALDRMVADGQRAGEVISSIRSMFGQDRRNKAPLKLNDLICDVLALVHGNLESQGVALQLVLSAEVVEVVADRVQLQQVLLNVFTNALEAMRSVADRPGLLAVKSQLLGPDEALILVEDNGCGIDPENADRIFEAFFTTKSHGMGMGLSICRSIVEAHGGRLWAAPGAVQGTVFYLTLPMPPAVQN
jgi:PAS domain S-box-containing protein